MDPVLVLFPKQTIIINKKSGDDCDRKSLYFFEIEKCITFINLCKRSSVLFHYINNVQFPDIHWNM